MSAMFYECSSLININFSNFNASNVKNDAFWYDFASTLMRGVVLEQKSTCAIMEGGTCSKTHKITRSFFENNCIKKENINKTTSC